MIEEIVLILLALFVVVFLYIHSGVAYLWERFDQERINFIVIGTCNVFCSDTEE